MLLKFCSETHCCSALGNKRMQDVKLHCWNNVHSAVYFERLFLVTKWLRAKMSRPMQSPGAIKFLSPTLSYVYIVCTLRRWISVRSSFASALSAALASFCWHLFIKEAAPNQARLFVETGRAVVILLSAPGAMLSCAIAECLR